MLSRIQNVGFSFLRSDILMNSDYFSSSLFFSASTSSWLRIPESSVLSARSALLSSTASIIAQMKESRHMASPMYSGNATVPNVSYSIGDSTLFRALPISGTVIMMPTAVASSFPRNQRLTIAVCEVIRFSLAIPKTARPMRMSQKASSCPPSATVNWPSMTRPEKITQPARTPI